MDFQIIRESLFWLHLPANQRSKLIIHLYLNLGRSYIPAMAEPPGEMCLFLSSGLWEYEETSYSVVLLDKGPLERWKALLSSLLLNFFPTWTYTHCTLYVLQEPVGLWSPLASRPCCWMELPLRKCRSHVACMSPDWVLWVAEGDALLSSH